MSAERLAIPRAQWEDLARLRDFVARACAAAGASEDVAGALVHACDEVCTNILQHGYAGRAPGPITVTVERVAGDAVVTIVDAGRPFDPADAPPPDLSSDWRRRKPGGLGVFLARHMVDELRYAQDAGGGNRITLVKRMTAPAGRD